MKDFLRLVFVFAAATFSCACANKEDGDVNSLDRFTAGSMATVKTVYTESSPAVIDDDRVGEIKVANPVKLTEASANSAGQRILYTYTLVDYSDGSSAASLKSVYKVLTKNADIVTGGNTSAYGTDPLLVTAVYISKAHINFRLMLKGSDGSITHKVSLTVDSAASIDDNGYLPVELHHSLSGDTPDSYKVGYAAITLASITGYTEGVVRGLTISYTDYSGNKAEIKVPVR